MALAIGWGSWAWAGAPGMGQADRGGCDEEDIRSIRLKMGLAAVWGAPGHGQALLGWTRRTEGGGMKNKSR